MSERIAEGRMTEEEMKPFIPSSTDLNDMVRRAMAKCDADVEQTRLREERRADLRMERAWTAEAKAIAWRRNHGGDRE
jgi:hypothetical protein